MTPSDSITIAVSVDHTSGDPLDAASTVLAVRSALRQLQPDGLEFIHGGTGSVQRDPLVAGAIVVAIAPVLVNKFVEAFRTVVERNKGAVIKLKMTTKDGRTISVEAPHNYSPKDLAELTEKIGAQMREQKQKGNAG